MDRRDFLKTTASAVTAAAFKSTDIGDGAGQRRGRVILPLNRGWRYSRSVTEGGHEPAFDDSQFERVVIPHTNVALPWHGFDDTEYEFLSLYRRKFRLPPGLSGQRVFADFEGVMTASTVWLNGQRVGEYKGGYTPFSFELTAHIDFEGDNVLAVEVDSSERADIPPFGQPSAEFTARWRCAWCRRFTSRTFLHGRRMF